MIARRSIGRDSIDGIDIPARAEILISPYLLHRDTRFWESPQKFAPERFMKLTGNTSEIGAYLPFGLGPRYCIGAELGMLELLMLLITIVRRFDLIPVDENPWETEALLTLRPKGSTEMMVKQVGN
jgi:cytochrome P450